MELLQQHERRARLPAAQQYRAIFAKFPSLLSQEEPES